MTDDLARRLSDLVDGQVPSEPPPFGGVLDRRDRRRRTRAVVVVGAAAAATAAVVVLTNAVGGPGDDRPAPPVATDGTPTPTRTALTPNPLSDEPPALVLGAPGGPGDAAQSSYCWGNGCADYGMPQRGSLPDAGSTAPLEVAFPTTGQWWFTVQKLNGSYGCAAYPALAEPVDDTHLLLTPSGPAGDRLASYFAYAEGGDTSGFWRWTVPERDGDPLSWVTVTQNSPSSGGMADLAVFIDDAAVDADVSAEVTVESASGSAETFALSQVDQHCADDGFVELGVPNSTPQGRIDGLGAAPYDYQVALTIDGTSYTGTGTWSGEGTEHGGDARLTFEPALPVLE